MATSLSQILGQEAALSILCQAFLRNRLHHAYLFEGIEGIGKFTCAKALFALMNCEKPMSLTESCGSCSSCQKVNSGYHPDFLLFEMNPSGLAEQVEKLLARLAYPPHEGKAQMVVFDPADVFSFPSASVAANRLLKTLEEPISNTYFVFICKNAANLLPTLRSRMQRIRFQPLAPQMIEQFLISRVPSVETRKMLTNLAQGSLGAALRYQEQSDLWKKRQELAHNLLQTSSSGNLLSIMKMAAQEEFNNREESQEILQLMWILLHQALRTKLHDSPTKQRKVIQQLALIQEAQEAIKRYINPTLTMERLLRKLG